MTKKFVLNFILSAICYVALGIALIVWPAASINVFCYVLGGVTAAYGLWQIYRFISHREERHPFADGRHCSAGAGHLLLC